MGSAKRDLPGRLRNIPGEPPQALRVPMGQAERDTSIMASQTSPKQGADHPQNTSDAKVEADVEQTFPASDPVAFTTSQGSRAERPEAMMHAEGSQPVPCDDGVTLSMRFPDSETAKLALEAAVREGPIDRRSAAIDLDDDRVMMRLEVPRADRERLDGLLRKHGAMDA